MDMLRLLMCYWFSYDTSNTRGYIMKWQSLTKYIVLCHSGLFLFAFPLGNKRWCKRSPSTPSSLLFNPLPSSLGNWWLEIQLQLIWYQLQIIKSRQHACDEDNKPLFETCGEFPPSPLVTCITRIGLFISCLQPTSGHKLALISLCRFIVFILRFCTSVLNSRITSWSKLVVYQYVPTKNTM
jgi:hypothetical protein